MRFVGLFFSSIMKMHGPKNKIMFFVTPQNYISKAPFLPLATQPLREKVYFFILYLRPAPGLEVEARIWRLEVSPVYWRQLLLPNFLRLYSEEWEDHRRHYAPFNCFRRLMRRSWTPFIEGRTHPTANWYIRRNELDGTYTFGFLNHRAGKEISVDIFNARSHALSSK